LQSAVPDEEIEPVLGKGLGIENVQKEAAVAGVLLIFRFGGAFAPFARPLLDSPGCLIRLAENNDHQGFDQSITAALCLFLFILSLANVRGLPLRYASAPEVFQRSCDYAL